MRDLGTIVEKYRTNIIVRFIRGQNVETYVSGAKIVG